MSRLHSPALTPFVRGLEPPYTTPDGIRVTAATPKVKYASAVKRSGTHLIASLAIAWAPEPVLGARWICGGGSTGARLFDLTDHPLGHAAEDPMDFVCQKCRDIVTGNGPRPCVYRVFDETGERLLYIGSTRNWDKRRSAHRTSTDWWKRIARKVDLTYYDTIDEAQAAEAAAIRAERPLMNIAHNRRPVSA